MTSIEAVWERLKSAALEYAKDGARLDTREAETLVAGFLRAEHVMPWPSADVIEFFASELLVLIERDRHTGFQSAE